jgi:hypothetical protein
MKHYLIALVLTGGLAAAQANACDYPKDPKKFPNGNSATKDEMVEAKKSVVQYNEDMKVYLDCLDKEVTDKLASMPNATEKEKADIQKKTDQKHDAAVIKLQSVADDFNVQLRAYKAKNTPEKPAS